MTGGYHERDGGLYADDKQLANFVVKIVEQHVVDSAQDGRPVRYYKCEAVGGGNLHQFTLPAAEFDTMGWVSNELGAQARVRRGDLQDLRLAILEVSGDPPTAHAYNHLGWKRISGKAVFLHADGAVGKRGLEPGVRVMPGSSLAGYRLPQPLRRSVAIRRATEKALALLEITDDATMVPLLCAVFRAPLGPSRSSLLLHGSTGSFKTTVAALHQQFFGRGLGADNLPGNFQSTANATETMADRARDVLFVMDDFAPRASARERDAQQATAERVLRGAGNGAGRSRLRRDSEPMEARQVRGTILVTGEDLPRGESLGSRFLVVQIMRERVDMTVLTACQRSAARGDYEQLMATYIQYLAARHNTVFESLTDGVGKLRRRYQIAGVHARTPEALAQLEYGMTLFTRFAVHAGAIDRDGALALRARVRRALLEVAAAQVQLQREARPATIFVEDVATALATEKAHLRVLEPGGRPSPRTVPDAVRRAISTPIGFLDQQTHLVYLTPNPAWLTASEIARASGRHLAVNERALGAALHREGLLARTDEARNKLKVRKNFGDGQREYFVLAAESLDLDPTARNGGAEEDDEVDD